LESWGGRLPPQFSIRMGHPAAFLRLMGYSLFPIPLLLLLIYLVTQFPRPQESLHIYPSLASVPRSNRVWEIYNEDYFPGGGYALLPYGRVSLQLDLFAPHTHAYQVRYWLMGPEDGEKVGCQPGSSCDCPLMPPLQVVLIPGLLLPAIIWKNVAPQLASHGFRVLLYGV